MPNKMLIDASHPEETRVVVTRGNRIEEFDFESQDKKQLRGNIYLARVTRVEPSLQAAFVEYGGNRHGFLAFSEIHPDYYQIPVADRQALLRAEAEAAERDEDDESSDGEERSSERGSNGNRNRNRRRRGRNRGPRDEAKAASGDEESAEAGSQSDDDGDTIDHEGSDSASDEAEDSAANEAESAAETSDNDDSKPEDDQPKTIAAAIEGETISEPVGETEEARGVIEEVPSRGGDDNEVESVGAEDALDEVRNRRKPVRRHYKIQEVIKRRQILLVQVVKEERGNKGAALTTYLSLAGRYSVLMPNTARGGGISRKITSAQDRKRLKDVMKELEVPQGMGVILRTAGENRTKAEIKRDYEYLMRLWENVRSLTLASSAPALVYEEGSLIKRSVRDLYNKDIDEILVAGEDGYREAKDFMRMLMPSHAKMVQPYRDTSPIFARSGIEAQLDRMLQPQVTLKSGGYIIINQTEALVSIDVNSGRSTREHSIEDTALQTNLEAADEVARQLRLRDLAGLIVIDFIDMEEHRNNRAVEKKLKDCLKNDRARIQVGRISHFGLMEMSRQRIRASVLESTMKPCPHCAGTGHVRSDSSIALMVVRAIEEHLLKDPRFHITVKTPVATALYVLNHKRGTLVELEGKFGLSITVEADDSVGTQHYSILRGIAVENPVEIADIRPAPIADLDEDDDIVEEIEDEEDTKAEAAETPQKDAGDGQGDRKRRKRRRRRGGRDRDREQSSANDGDDAVSADAASDGDDDDAEEQDAAEPKAVEAVAEESEADRKKRRRGKRGGKRGRDKDDDTATEEAAAGDEPVVAAEAEAPVVAEPVEAAEPAAEEPAKKPARKPRRSAKTIAAEKAAAEAAEQAATEPVAVEPVVEEVAAPVAEEPKKPSRRKAAASEAPAAPKVSSTVQPEATAPEASPKKGWWQRKSFF